MQNANLKNDNKKNYNYLSYIVSIYSFFFLLPSILLHKMVNLPVIGIVPISILFTGIYFILLDVVTEVYGYKEGRKTLLSGLLTYTIFVFVVDSVSHISSPKNNIVWGHDQDAHFYINLFGNLHVVWISVVICALLTSSLNMIVLAKWKILVMGKYFWLRSISTSFVAAFFYSLISNLFAFGVLLGEAKFSYFIKLLLVSLFSKLFTLIIFAYPASLFCYFLKSAEGIDQYDYDLSFNPFINLNNESLAR